MFHTWPVKMSTMDPELDAQLARGNSDTMASITPGRKLRTGMDCRMSSTATMTRFQAFVVGGDVSIGDREHQAQQVGDDHAYQRIEGIAGQGARRTRDVAAGVTTPIQ